MHYKKILFILFFVLLLFIVFQKKKEENIFSFWTVQLKAPAGDIIQKNIDYFETIHPDIKVVWVDIPIAEAKKRAIASILGGNPPDLINLNPEYSALLAQKNLLEYFSDDEVDSYNEALVEKLKYEGKIYALPFYATSAVTIYNKEKFQNCSLPDKYEDILKLKKCKNSIVYGISLNEGDSFAKILSKYNLNTPDDFSYVYSLFHKMQKENLLLPDTLSLNHREVIEKYMAGSATFITTGSNFINMIKENAPNIYKISDVAPQLKGKKEEYDISLMNFVIPNKAKNKELAKEFAALLLNSENQLEFAKKTNVLPANKTALNNAYFKNCGSGLIDKARCLAAFQLNYPLNSDFGYKNRTEINDAINSALETLFLEGEENFNPQNLFEVIKILQNK